MLIYHILNIFFFVFHTLLIIFNLFGWIHRKTRFANLITQSLTFFSWFVLGFFYGIGYCFCTDWHWMVRRKLGLYDNFNSYIQLLVYKLTGISLDINIAVILAMTLFFISFIISIILNIVDLRKYLKKRKK